MKTLDTTDLIPATNEHILHVLASKHYGQTVTMHYRTGGEVVYSVNNKI